MWKIKDIIENIVLGSKFKHGMYICTKTEVDDRILTIYTNVYKKTVAVDIDTEPSLNTTDDVYNILYDELKKNLKGFKINIKTKRTKQQRQRKKKENDDVEIETKVEKRNSRKRRKNKKDE